MCDYIESSVVCMLYLCNYIESCVHCIYVRLHRVMHILYLCDYIESSVVCMLYLCNYIESCLCCIYVWLHRVECRVYIVSMWRQVAPPGNVVCRCSETLDVHLWQSRHWATLSQDVRPCPTTRVSALSRSPLLFSMFVFCHVHIPLQRIAYWL